MGLSSHNISTKSKLIILLAFLFLGALVNWKFLFVDIHGSELSLITSCSCYFLMQYQHHRADFWWSLLNILQTQHMWTLFNYKSRNECVNAKLQNHPMWNSHFLQANGNFNMFKTIAHKPKLLCQIQLTRKVCQFFKLLKFSFLVIALLYQPNLVIFCFKNIYLLSHFLCYINLSQYIDQ